MSFWIQHGYGKSDKITRVRTSLDGVVLSPADESVDGLSELRESMNADDISCLLDPQYYVRNIEGASAHVTRLEDRHGLNYADIDWSSDPQEIADCARNVVAANSAIGLDKVVAPAPLQRVLGDKWAPLGLQFARAVRGEVGSESTYASLVLHETALTKWQDVEQWLTSITKLDICGFYVVIVRSAGSDYPAAWESERLTNLYRIVLRLVNNEYEVIVGYSDIDGLGCVAMGGAMATGWFHSQRRFQEAKWKPSEGGAQALPRFLSDRLLYPLRLDDARDLLSGGEGAWVSTVKADRDSLSGAFDITTSRNQYLASMARLAARVAEPEGTPARIDRLLTDLQRASTELRRLGDGPMARGTTYSNQLERIVVALKESRRAEGLAENP